MNIPIKVIKKESLSLDTQIRFLIKDLTRHSAALVDIEKQLDNTRGDETLRDHVVESLADNVIKYSNTSQELRSKLEEFFVYEETHGLPRNLAFYSMYKKITKV